MSNDLQWLLEWGQGESRMPIIMGSAAPVCSTTVVPTPSSNEQEEGASISSDLDWLTNFQPDILTSVPTNKIHQPDSSATVQQQRILKTKIEKCSESGDSNAESGDNLSAQDSDLESDSSSSIEVEGVSSDSDSNSETDDSSDDDSNSEESSAESGVGM